ncbi:MAG: ECF transporter S component [Acutalibacteraceae bacterium]
MNKNTQSNTRKVVFMGLICALAYVCTLVFHIKVSFLTFDLKNTVLAVGALIFGPVSGIITSLIVSVVEMITISDTGIWGCIMNFLSSAIYTFIAGLIYKYKRTLSGAIIALSVASVAMVASMIPLNLIFTPIYTGSPVSVVADMIIPLLLPFNVIKAVLCSAVTLLIYKPVRTVFKGAGLSLSSDKDFKFNKKSLAITVISLLIIALCVFLFVYAYNGTFELY